MSGMGSEPKKSDEIDVIGKDPTLKEGIMGVIKREFDRDMESLNPLARFKTRMARDERVYETLAKGIAEKAEIALTAYRDAAAAEKFQRRANIAVVKDQVYNQYVEMTEVSKREAINRLQVASKSILSESGMEFQRLEETVHERLEGWNALLAEGKMAQERYDKRVADLYADADKIYEKCRGAVDAHLNEIIDAFIDSVKTFTPRDRDAFE